jgi:hypothetical protein
MEIVTGILLLVRCYWTKHQPGETCCDRSDSGGTCKPSVLPAVPPSGKDSNPQQICGLDPGLVQSRLKGAIRLKSGGLVIGVNDMGRASCGAG